MACGYADRLLPMEDYGGTLGSAERADVSASLERAARALADAVAAAEGEVVLFTGAGLSTACGIPDFRGPNGVWTREKQGLPKVETDVAFATAVPSLGHALCAQLVAMGKAKRIVSQNVDGLHLRSGVPPSKLTELHGNTFVETCETCHVDHVRDFEVETVGFKRTGRTCEHCGGKLRDFVLDWDSPIRDADLDNAYRSIDASGVVITLGTSLQITPAGSMPQRCRKRGGKLCIVNLQKTPKDKLAMKDGLRIFGTCDAVLARVWRNLGLPPVPDFVRTHTVAIGIERARASHKASAGSHVAYVRSVHGARKCPMPWVSAVDFAVTVCATPDSPSTNFVADGVRPVPSTGSGSAGRGNGEPKLFFGACAPFRTSLPLPDGAEVQIRVTLHLAGSGSSLAVPAVVLRVPARTADAGDAAAAPGPAEEAPEALPSKRRRTSSTAAASAAHAAAVASANHAFGLGVASAVPGWRSESLASVEALRVPYDPTSALA